MLQKVIFSFFLQSLMIYFFTYNYRHILDSRSPITFTEQENRDFAESFEFSDLYIFGSIGKQLEHPVMFGNLMRSLHSTKTAEIKFGDAKLKAY